jgi:hypothetical protein
VQLSNQFVARGKTRVARIDIGNFAVSNYVDGIDGKFADGSAQFASSPNGRSLPTAKGKRDAACLDAFKMFSLEEHRLCQPYAPN